ncbi:MAG: cysteine desulfurase [Christensenellaceae bacterium]|nr:cysteine desulfurase [Christensenellaceae bacterium]
MIYVDNAATTKLSSSVLDKVLPFMADEYGNPSSLYSIGVKAKRAIDVARNQIAIAIGASPNEILFTSGGSESNNWVFQSIKDCYHNQPLHIITTEIEHHSVLNICHELSKNGVEITFIPVNRNGQVSPVAIENALKPHTRLVSVMFANNEIGAIQPILEIGNILKERQVLFHTDAVQAVGHLPLNVSNLNINFLTASAHKFNGIMGVGFLFKRANIKFQPLILGGSQEQNNRAGTENVPGIVAMGHALEESMSILDTEYQRLRKMTELTIEGLKSKISGIRVNGCSDRLPGLINIGFDGILGESLMHMLDLKGICVSTSAACTAGENKISHVLRAIGLSEECARASIRISFGRYNTFEEVEMIVNAICSAYAKIKGISHQII